MREHVVAARGGAALLALTSVLLQGGVARAEGAGEAKAAVVWPTVVAEAQGGARLPTSKDGDLGQRAREIDDILADTAQDLGLTLDVSSRPHAAPKSVRDGAVVDEAKASRAWIISPRIEREGSGFVVRIVAARPGSKVLLSREERVTSETLPTKVVVMFRDLVASQPVEREAKAAPSEPQSKGRTTSPGRGVLLVSTAAFGGYVGYSLQRSSRSEDQRLLYPLMAIGTAVGLGAATIVADEWDVGVGDAWFLAAGMWWPTTSALLLSSGYGVEPSSDGHAFALLSGIAGAGVSTVALSFRGVSEGGALLTHSGALLGTFLGGTTELLVRGSTEVTPEKGLGFGAGAGVLVGGALAMAVPVTPAKVLSLDVGAGLGALGGAALGSPLLLKNATEGKQRAFVGATMAGTVVGAGLGLWLGGGSGGSARVPMPSLSVTREGGQLSFSGVF